MTETSPLGSVVAAAGAASTGEERVALPRHPGPAPGRRSRRRLVGPDGSRAAARRRRRSASSRSAGRGSPASYYRDDDPDKFDDGWLRTGDVGTITPDGFLTLTDRAKDVIKSGGEWISSVELENALMAHPAVAEASVVGVPGREVGRAAAGHGRACARAPTVDGRRAARRSSAEQVATLAAAGALGLHRRGAEDLGRQVRQEGAAQGRTPTGSSRCRPPPGREVPASGAPLI